MHTKMESGYDDGFQNKEENIITVAMNGLCF